MGCHREKESKLCMGWEYCWTGAKFMYKNKVSHIDNGF